MIGWISPTISIRFHAVLEPAGARDHYGHETSELPNLLLFDSNTKTTITLAHPEFLRITVFNIRKGCLIMCTENQGIK